MEQENPKVKKVFTNIVGVAAACAIIFLGVTGLKPATFLGGVAEKNGEELSSLKISPSVVRVEKGGAFSVDIILHVGDEVPKDTHVVVQYDSDSLIASYVNTVAASFDGIEKHYRLGSDSVEITGTFLDGNFKKGDNVTIGKIYFRTLQNIGSSHISFDEQASSVMSPTNQSILGDVQDASVNIAVE
jgi:hypothetical protein